MRAIRLEHTWWFEDVTEIYQMFPELKCEENNVILEKQTLIKKEIHPPSKTSYYLFLIFKQIY